MKEKVKAVEITKKTEIIQSIRNFLLMFVNPDDNSENIEDFENIEDVELLPELKATVESVTAKAEKLNNRNEKPKGGNNLKGLKGKVQVVEAPTISKNEFYYNKEKEDIEISE